LKPFYGTPPADWGTPPSSSDTVPQYDNSQLNDGPPEQTAGGDFADPDDGADAVDQLPGYENDNPTINTPVPVSPRTQRRSGRNRRRPKKFEDFVVTGRIKGLPASSE